MVWEEVAGLYEAKPHIFFWASVHSMTVLSCSSESPTGQMTYQPFMPRSPSRVEARSPSSARVPMNTLDGDGLWEKAMRAATPTMSASLPTAT